MVVEVELVVTVVANVGTKVRVKMITAVILSFYLPSAFFL